MLICGRQLTSSFSMNPRPLPGDGGLTSSLAILDAHVQQVVDDPAAVQDADQLVPRRLRHTQRWSRILSRHYSALVS